MVSCRENKHGDVTGMGLPKQLAQEKPVFVLLITAFVGLCVCVCVCVLMKAQTHQSLLVMCTIQYITYETPI